MGTFSLENEGATVFRARFDIRGDEQYRMNVFCCKKKEYSELQEVIYLIVLACTHDYCTQRYNRVGSTTR